MRRILNTFRSFSAADQRLLLEALLYLVIGALLVRLIPFRRWAAWLGTTEAIVTQPLASPQLERARRIKWAVSVARRRLPWHSTCLMDAFAAQRLLAHRSIPHQLILGVRFEGETERYMSAHAWITVGDEALIGGGVHQGFKPVAVFSR